MSTAATVALYGESRLSRAIAAAEMVFTDLSPEEVAKVDQVHVLDFAEHFDLQRLQSTCFASGLLSEGEAQIMYHALGEVGSPDNGGWAAETTTAEKYAITQFAGLLARDMIIEKRGLAV